MQPRLFVDLVPRSAWFSNLRSELTPAEWDLARRKTYRNAGMLCQACGGKGPTHPVEAHERWHFCEETAVQTLTGIDALCPACHEATHYGLARVRGREAFARAQLKKVNGWTDREINAHVAKAMDAYVRRTEIEDWTLDARWLLDYVTLSEETRNKILEHAAQLRDREVQSWQQDIIDQGD